MKTRLWAAGGILITGLCAFAEEEPPAAAARTAGPQIEEMVVTAQKRRENLQDVPISMQAFGADTLESRSVLDLQELPQITPGLTITTTVAYASTYIRGVGTDAFLLADPSVATYYDGTYQPFPNSVIQDFGEIERVEVLKGPQGTLFGRNAVGGAINVITRAPSLENWRVSARTGYKSHDTFENRLYLSVPYRETLALSFSGVYNEGDHHVDGRVGVDGESTGKPLPKIRARAGRLQLRFAPFEWVDLQLTGLDVNNKGPTTSYTPNVRPSDLFGASIEPQDPYAGANSEDLFFNHDNRLGYGQLSFFTDWLDVKVLGSVQKANSFFNYDFDSSPEELALFQIDNVFGDVHTAELQLISNEGSPAAGWFRWIVGGYYFESETGFDPSFFRSANTNLDEGVLVGTPVPPALLPALRAAVGATAVPTGDIHFVGLLGTESFAGFAQSTFTPIDFAALTLGFRYQRETRTLIESSSSLRNGDGTLTPIQTYRAGQDPVVGGVPMPDSGPPLVDVTESLDPKVSLEFRPRASWVGGWLGDEPLLYFTWQTATKSSTYNTVNINDPPDLVLPEDITAYEVGFKTTLFDGLANLSFALFDYDIQNQQSQFISLLAGGAVTFENAGSVSIQGVEFDASSYLFPSWVDGLRLSGGAAFIDPVYASYPNGSGFDENGILTQNNDFSGNQVVRSPEASSTAALTKAFGFDWGSIEIGGNYYYNGGFFYSAQNSPAAEEDAYDLLGFHTQLRLDRWGLTATVFGDNVLKEGYSYSKFPTDFGVGDARAPRAVYGGRLQMEF